MKNEGVIDRTLRFIFALALMAAGSFLVDGWMRLVLYVLALMLAITATTGFCLLYKVLDIDTLSNKKGK